MGGYELVIDILHITDAGKGHLLFDVMAEPVAADGVAKGRRHDGAKEQTAINHRLEGESAANGERHAPVGVHIAHTRLTVLKRAPRVGKYQLSSLL